MTATPAGAPALRPAQPSWRQLAGLLTAVPGLTCATPVDAAMVRGCTHDSRSVQPGDLYAALAGEHAHGANFVEQALAAGATAVLTDPAGAERSRVGGVPVLVAANPRTVLGNVASWVYGHPSSDLLLFGVTGTNGKTTTSYMLEAGLRAAGHLTGLVGTVETRIGSDRVASVRTTPEAPDLQALLAVMRERGVGAVAMEISSHALALGRADGLICAVAGFTNLTQDHLDFHRDMAEYLAAKATLFTAAKARRAVVTVDDGYGVTIAGGATIPIHTLSGIGPADWSVHSVECAEHGSAFLLDGPGGRLAGSTQLAGRFNVDNAALALAMLVDGGIPAAAAVEGVAGLRGVPGRMERVEAGQPFVALVDYAHTPEAVATLLRSVRGVTAGRVIVVLGCGGDRDRTKRPLMGQAAMTGADLVVLTSDNPRSEDPLAILREMQRGAPGALVEPDRAEAIGLAVAAAGPGDAVVVAGKGHETVQEAGGVAHPFDDRAVLLAALRASAQGGPG